MPTRFRLSLFVLAAWLLWLIISVNASLTPLIGYDEQRMAEFGLLGLTLLLPSLHHPLPDAVRWSMALFAGCGLCSAGLSSHWFLALSEWSVLMACLCAVPALSEHLQHSISRWQDTLATALIISCCLYVIGAMAGWLAGMLTDAGWQPGLMLHHFDNPRFFAQWAIFQLPLLYWFRASRRIIQVGLVALRASMVMLLLASGSRGAVMALILAWVILITTIPAFSPRYRNQTIRDALIGVLLYGFLFYWAPLLTGVEHPSMGAVSLLRANSSGRSTLWLHALALVSAHPWLGIGPGLFANWPNPFGAHPHNFILQLASEWGLPACASFLFLVMYSLRAWIATLQNPHQSDNCTAMPQHVLLYWAILSALLLGLVDGVLVTPVSQAMLVLVTAWALAVRKTAIASTKPPSNVTRYAPAGWRLLLVTTLFTSNIPGVQQHWQSTTISTPAWSHPRIWADSTIRPPY